MEHESSSEIRAICGMTEFSDSDFAPSRTASKSDSSSTTSSSCDPAVANGHAPTETRFSVDALDRLTVQTRLGVKKRWMGLLKTG